MLGLKLTAGTALIASVLALVFLIQDCQRQQQEKYQALPQVVRDHDVEMLEKLKRVNVGDLFTLNDGRIARVAVTGKWPIFKYQFTGGVYYQETTIDFLARHVAQVVKKGDPDYQLVATQYVSTGLASEQR